MENGQISRDKYFERLERLVRGLIGTQLDQMKKDFEQLDSPVMVRLMNAQLNKPLTIDELLSFEPSRRQGILSAVLQRKLTLPVRLMWRNFLMRKSRNMFFLPPRKWAGFSATLVIPRSLYTTIL